MANIIKADKLPEKDCLDWCPLRDGTRTGDIVYCDHSLICKQTDAQARGFVSHWHKFRDEMTGEEAFDYFCTGMYPKEVEEGREDKEVS